MAQFRRGHHVARAEAAPAGANSLPLVSMCQGFREAPRDVDSGDLWSWLTPETGTGPLVMVAVDGRARRRGFGICHADPGPHRRRSHARSRRTTPWTAPKFGYGGLGLLAQRQR